MIIVLAYSWLIIGVVVAIKQPHTDPGSEKLYKVFLWMAFWPFFVRRIK